jgi:cytochrome c-type biogenesis protein CcmH
MRRRAAISGSVRALLAAAAGALCLAAASDPAERLKDPAQEARAREIFAEVRCLVCQNESIDDSEAELARDLRRIVREQVAQGRNESEIKAFLIARYGEFVLLRPRLSLGNAVLWGAPAFVLLAGLLLWRARLRGTEPEAELSPEEDEKLRLLALEAQPGNRTPEIGP